MSLPTQFQVGDGSRIHARLDQMSIGGCFVETREAQRFGTELTLFFHVPGSSTEFVLSAVVRWTSAKGMGVQFGALRAREAYVLSAFLAKKPSVPPAAPAPRAVPPRLPARQQRPIRTSERGPPVPPPAAARAARAKPPAAPGLVEGDAELAQAKREIERLQAERSEWTVQRDTMQQLASDRAERIRQLEAELAQLQAELTEAKTRLPAPGDDLTRIRGIGPVFDRALKSLGVSRFAQIAAWTEADIDDIARKLKSSSSRIRREGWVKSAADRACGHHSVSDLPTPVEKQ